MCGTLCTQCVEQYVPNVWLCDRECVMYAGTADLTGPDSVAVRLGRGEGEEDTCWGRLEVEPATTTYAGTDTVHHASKIAYILIAHSYPIYT